MPRLTNNDCLTADFDAVGATVSKLWFRGLPIATKGSIKGRCANRIAGAEFMLCGQRVVLPANDGANHLHGGFRGFSKQEWNISDITDASIAFTLNSPDGDEGYPGNLQTTVTYTLSPANELVIEFAATCDTFTIYNPVNHLYLNLNGYATGTALDSTASGLHKRFRSLLKTVGRGNAGNAGSMGNAGNAPQAFAHRLRIDADAYTPVGAGLIPTGDIASVEGTVFDYRTMRDFSGNYDINYVLCAPGERNPEPCFREVACLVGVQSGITCRVYTDRPGLQLYNTDTEVCLEAQAFPDAVHHRNFPLVVLPPSRKFYTKTVYAFCDDDGQHAE